MLPRTNGRKGRSLLHKAFPSSDHLQAMGLAISISFLQPGLPFPPASALLAPFTYWAWVGCAAAQIGENSIRLMLTNSLLLLLG